jgi:hypothetical protein
MHLTKRRLIAVAALNATLFLHSRAAHAGDPTDRRPRSPFEHPDPRLPADPADRAILVHVHSPDPVVLERETGNRYEPFASICTSPCDTLVPASGRYRITGDSIRSSRPFTFPTDAAEDTLDVNPTSPLGFAGGIALVSLGGAALQIGLLWALAASYADFDSGTPDRAPAVGLLIGGVVCLVTGGVLWASNGKTRVSQTRGPQVEAPLARVEKSGPSPALANLGVARLAPASPMAPAFTLPLVVGTF